MNMRYIDISISLNDSKRNICTLFQIKLALWLPRLKGQSWLLFGSLVSFFPWVLGVVVFQLKRMYFSILTFLRECSIKQAEKLKSCEMKEGWMKSDEGWIKNYEGWRMNDEGWWFQAVEEFRWQTDKQTFVNVESLLQLKNAYFMTSSKSWVINQH